MTSAWELRNDVREALGVDRVEHEHLKRPFRKDTLNKAYAEFNGREMHGGKSIGHIRYHLLQEVPDVERDALECDTPLCKDETKALLEALES